ncbi:methyltransferase domain-containing protein [Nodularia harveyana UHCC-0300]|uniref:Methyltransferase domain-containing protein n=1 Tax=Nodularia harveyana UHCC-0300 TaxID=2974287 RepID=A0ABU5UIK2_9CYAN|nr:methyltransferase domain-containing protein [Nodularia harveyana]MEA5583319.1 methyltransferase domain-containing protein [Nodularia harveyana UHCC-0300]
MQDLTQYYENSKINFICGDACSTPFNDKEFDFVFASHVAEHVTKPIKFCTELMRISSRGYIEVPTPLFDNLILNNHDGHLWWVTFDDIQASLKFSPKIGVLKEVISIEENNLLFAFFRESMVTEIYWEDEINSFLEDTFVPYYPLNNFESLNISSYQSDKIYKMPKWELGNKSKLGFREKFAHILNSIIRKTLILD